MLMKKLKHLILKVKLWWRCKVLKQSCEFCEHYVQWYLKDSSGRCELERRFHPSQFVCDNFRKEKKKNGTKRKET